MASKVDFFHIWSGRDLDVWPQNSSIYLCLKRPVNLAKLSKRFTRYHDNKDARTDAWTEWCMDNPKYNASSNVLYSGGGIKQLHTNTSKTNCKMQLDTLCTTLHKNIPYQVINLIHRYVRTICKYLRSSRKLTGSQISLPHQINTLKINEK